MIRRCVAILTVSLVLLSLGGPISQGAAPATPSGGGPEIVGVHVGVAGRYKAGCWTQVRVALRGVQTLTGAEVVLTVPDGDGVPSQFSTPLPSPSRDAATDSTLVVLYARFGRAKSELAVEVRSAEGAVARRAFKPGATPDYQPAVLSEQELVITVGPGPLGIEEAVRLLDQEPDRRTVVVRVEELDDLPARWYGYEAVDLVVLSTSEPGIYAGLEPGDLRVAALDEWVRLGGRLVLCGGEHAGELLGGKSESALGLLAPGRVKDMVPLRGMKDIELYAGSSVRMPRAEGELLVPHLVDVDGRIEAADGGLPLVVRGAHGFGQVTFVAAALDRAPFDQWEDLALLTGKLLDYPASPGDEDEQSTAVMHYGYTDLAGQLRSALDQFPSVWLVPFWLVVGLVVLYVLAIGPGDYFFLRKVAGRMQLTWLTFPLIVVAFSAAAYLLAHRFKGDQVRVNQVDLVDVDVESGRVRGTAWANVFSPRMNRYDLAFEPRLLGGRPQGEAAALCAWLGLPGDALGGMSPRTAEPAVWQMGYAFSGDLDALDDVPIPIWSTKSLTGRWTARADVAVEGRLKAEEGLLEGTIHSTLPFTLSDCLLAYGIHAYELGSLSPGETARVGPSLVRRELKSLLTGRQIIIVEKGKNDDYHSQSTPYDPASVDVAYVLRAMMFHEAAGGRAYTGMSNRYQGFVDLSHLLKTGRAVLVGRVEPADGNAEHHGAELLCNGRPVPPGQVRHTAAYRFVFPVEGEEWITGKREWRAWNEE